MKNELLKNVLHVTRIAIMMVLVGLLAYFFTPKAFAQGITTPYWCRSSLGLLYWSSQPCLPGQAAYPYYNYQNYYQQNYNYYPNNYYPYQNYQYYYPQPTCNISYSYTNNPNYWSGGMYQDAVQLSWSSNYATSAYISPDRGSVSQAGIRVAYPYGYVTYRMTVYGPGGSNTCSINVQPRYQPQQYYWNQYYYNPNYNYGYPYYF